MTHQEIEDYRKQLAEILAKKVQGKYKPEVKQELQNLAEKVGASTYAVFEPAHPAAYRALVTEAEIPELAYNIHQALQTASMVNMCETASRGHDIAVSATKNAKWTAVVLAIVSVLSMVAAWYAALRN
jgi:hypothetical protein